MIDTAASEPLETGIPQRGAITPRLKPERRSDQMSVRMKPSTRARIEELAKAMDMPIAEVIENAINAFRPS